MRVLMIVQLVDEHEWLRGFTVGWIRTLAAKVEWLHVITLEEGEADLPENVTVQSMGKEKGYGRLRELWQFERCILRVIDEVDVIFSHMTPRFTWLAAPLAALFGKPQMLWFTHRQKSGELRLAMTCARWITTATHDSFPFKSPKVHVMGHGIDTGVFSPDSTLPDDPPLVLAVARISRIKHHHTLLEAAARLRDCYDNPPVRFGVVGITTSPEDEEYYESLIRRRSELNLSDEQFTFFGGQSQTGLAKLYRRASITTNLSPVGLFDKAALEAMLIGKPLIVANPAFNSLLGLYADRLLVEGPNDAAGVASKLAALLALSPDERAAMGLELRERTAADHSLDRLMDKLVHLMQEGMSR